MAPAIPDRWLDYKPIGDQIEGTRFIAFKVPLKANVNKNIDEPIRLDVKMLMEKVPKLGLIIDLTNTNRYYDGKWFQGEGVQYQKLKIPGHVTPAVDLVNKFKSYVKKFLSDNPDNDKIIGVHCTHGVNRTGYLICNYMISEMNSECQEAINKFNSARGHPIERNNYINSLHCLNNAPTVIEETNSNGNDMPKNSRSRSKESIASRHPYSRNKSNVGIHGSSNLAQVFAHRSDNKHFSRYDHVRQDRMLKRRSKSPSKVRRNDNIYQHQTNRQQYYKSERRGSYINSGWRSNYNSANGDWRSNYNPNNSISNSADNWRNPHNNFLNSNASWRSNDHTRSHMPNAAINWDRNHHPGNHYSNSANVNYNSRYYQHARNSMYNNS